MEITLPSADKILLAKNFFLIREDFIVYQFLIS